jgi:hypothetical protein
VVPRAAQPGLLGPALGDEQGRDNFRAWELLPSF